MCLYSCAMTQHSPRWTGPARKTGRRAGTFDYNAVASLNRNERLLIEEEIEGAIREVEHRLKAVA